MIRVKLTGTPEEKEFQMRVLFFLLLVRFFVAGGFGLDASVFGT